MKANISFNHSDEYAVSELVGGLLLVLIAIMVFSAIYLYVFPLPLPASESNVKLEGYVTNDGLVVIEHKGGESLSYYRTDVKYINGTLIDTTTYQNEENPWQIGEYNYPLGGIYLLTEDDAVNITIYEIKENSEETVFDGVIKGKNQPTLNSPNPSATITVIRGIINRLAKMVIGVMIWK